MILISFTLDSKRKPHGGEVIVGSLAEGRRIINQKSGLVPNFTPIDAAHYERAWEVTCGDTVIAYAYDQETTASAIRRTAMERDDKLIAAATKHANFLESTLIPDLRASGSNFTADDFARCVGFMRALMGIEEGMDECVVCHKRFNATRRDKSPICRACK
jgi:hypothetical protein